MTETYWNGLPAPAERVRVVVDRSPQHTWWCADLAGTERAAVRVGDPGPDAIYLDDEDGLGWWKVTEGKGSPRVGHRSLPVAREVPGGSPAATERDTKLLAIDAAYTAFESTGDLHELARAVGTVLDRKADS